MFIKLIVIKWRLSDFFSDRSHIDPARFVLTIKLYLLSWSERWMTIFGSSGEFQEAFFYHIASWKVDVCVIAFLNTRRWIVAPGSTLRLGEVGFPPSSSKLIQQQGWTNPEIMALSGSSGRFSRMFTANGRCDHLINLRRFFAFVVLKAKRLVSSYSTWNNWWKWVKRNFRIMKASYLWRLLR